MNRFIYITLGLISLLVPPILFITDISDNRIFSLYLMYFVISLIWSLFDGIIKHESPHAPGEFIPFFFMPFTLNRKRIYYSGLNDIYISQSGTSVNVYKQGSLASEYLFSVDYIDENSLKSNIKCHLDHLYKKEIENNNRIKQSKSVFKNWNGYLDKESERDSKLNDILK